MCLELALQAQSSQLSGGSDFYGKHSQETQSPQCGGERTAGRREGEKGDSAVDLEVLTYLLSLLNESEVTFSPFYLWCLVQPLVPGRCSVIVCLMKVNVIKQLVTIAFFSLCCVVKNKITLYIA